MQFKQVSYEEARLEFFREQYVNAKKKLAFWVKALNSKRYVFPQSEYEDICSECGAQIGYYADAIKMFGGEIEDENT